MLPRERTAGDGLTTPPNSRESVLDGVLVRIVDSTGIPSTLSRWVLVCGTAPPVLLAVTRKPLPASEGTTARSLEGGVFWLGGTSDLDAGCKLLIVRSSATLLSSPLTLTTKRFIATEEETVFLSRENCASAAFCLILRIRSIVALKVIFDPPGVDTTNASLPLPPVPLLLPVT